VKVLLTQDVKGLGKAGEVKEVKEGYGNNFLIGKGLAKAATPSVMAQYNAELKKKAEEDAAELARLKELAAKLEKAQVTIAKKAGVNGHLFGAITKDEIAHAFAEAGLEFDKKAVEIDNPIKEIGCHEISIKLGHSLHPKTKLEIVGE
jgi:large subunit ribosomal protein L9